MHHDWSCNVKKRQTSYCSSKANPKRKYHSSWHEYSVSCKDLFKVVQNDTRWSILGWAWAFLCNSEEAFSVSLGYRWQWVPLSQMSDTINEVLNIHCSLRHPTSLIFTLIFSVLGIDLFPTGAKPRFFHGNIRNRSSEFTLASRRSKFIKLILIVWEVDPQLEYSLHSPTQFINYNTHEWI